MPRDRKQVCPVELAGSLDSRLRWWLQRPDRILAPHLKPGMTAIDLGCGPGMFTVEMARQVGNKGKVFAVDLQEGMLDKLRRKLAGSDLESRVSTHKCDTDRIALSIKADFALAFFMVHEVPDKLKFFREVASMLKRGGRMLVVEPPFHVSRKEFLTMAELTPALGYNILDSPRISFCKSLLLQRQ